MRLGSRITIHNHALCFDSTKCSDKDTISFISEFESAANAFGVTMQTTGLSVTLATIVAGVSNPPVLSVGIQVVPLPLR